MKIDAMRHVYGGTMAQTFQLELGFHLQYADFPSYVLSESIWGNAGGACPLIQKIVLKTFLSLLMKPIWIDLNSVQNTSHHIECEISLQFHTHLIHSLYRMLQKHHEHSWCIYQDHFFSKSDNFGSWNAFMQLEILFTWIRGQYIWWTVQLTVVGAPIWHEYITG